MEYEISFTFGELEVIETFTCIPRIGEHVWLNFTDTLAETVPYRVLRVDYSINNRSGGRTEVAIDVEATPWMESA
jgi:hypothetical protein